MKTPGRCSAPNDGEGFRPFIGTEAPSRGLVGGSRVWEGAIVVPWPEPARGRVTLANQFTTPSVFRGDRGPTGNAPRLVFTPRFEDSRRLHADSGQISTLVEECLALDRRRYVRFARSLHSRNSLRIANERRSNAENTRGTPAGQAGVPHRDRGFGFGGDSERTHMPKPRDACTAHDARRTMGVRQYRCQSDWSAPGSVCGPLRSGFPR